MMRVVFLDIDGVLNSMRFLSAFDALATYNEWKHPWIDITAVGHLNLILKATGACVVISSAWRRLCDLDALTTHLKNHNLEGQVIGATPDLTHLDRGDRPLWRGDEIEHWVRTSPRKVDFVILDDGRDMGHLAHRLVQTDSAVGLTYDDALRAIALLEQT